MSSSSDLRSSHRGRFRSVAVGPVRMLAAALSVGALVLMASCEEAREPLGPEGSSAITPGDAAGSLSPHLTAKGSTIQGYLPPSLDILPTEEGFGICAAWTDDALTDGGFETEFFSFDFDVRDAATSSEVGQTVWTRWTSVRGDAEGQGACVEFKHDDVAEATAGLDDGEPWLRVDAMARSGRGQATRVHHTAPAYHAGEGSPPDDPSAGVSAPVGEEGGELTLLDSEEGVRAILTIPAGALSEEITIRISPEADPALDDGSFVVPGTTVFLSPSGLEFATPVTLTLPFDPTTLPSDIDPEDLEIRRVNSDGSTTPQPTVVNVGASTATAALASFSTYLLAPPPPPILDQISLWEGGASPDPRDWHDPANWSGSGRVPDEFTPAMIFEDSEHFPRITAPANVQSLTIREGASLEMVGYGIGIYGSLISHGSFTSEGGALVTMFGPETRGLEGTLPNLGINEGTTALSGDVTIEGRVTVRGISPTLEIGTHVIEIGGDLEVDDSQPARLLMTEPLGRVIVHGNASFTAPWPGEAPLRAGTLELKGNFSQGQAAAFKTAGTHRTLFSGGDRTQMVTVDESDVPGAGFRSLTLGHTTEVMLLSDVRAEALEWTDAGVGARISGGTALTVVNAAFIRGPVSVDELRIGGTLSWSGHPYLVSTTVFTGEGLEILQPQTIPHVPYHNVVVMGDDVTLDDEFVTVRGEFRILDGSFRAADGRLLTVMGNFVTEGRGGLRMLDDDRIVVYGNVDFQGEFREPGLDGGRIWIGGDVTGGYGARNEHRTIMFSAEGQELMNENAIRNLVITNVGPGVNFHQDAFIIPFLDLVGNSRILEDVSISLTHVNFRSTSRTIFERNASFNCTTGYRESGAISWSDGGLGGCNPPLEERQIDPTEFPLEDYYLPSALDVQITSPLQGITVGENQAITFSASAFMSGIGVDAAFEWISSRDGVLGEGSTIEVESLSAGVHSVTAKAETPDGLVGLDFIIVRVGEPATVEVTPATAEAERLSTLNFTAEVFDEFGGLLGDTQVTWTTSNACVASVDEFGTVTTHGGGTAQIIASAGSAQGSASLTVEDAPSGVPTTVAGQWRVCEVWTGDYVGLLDIEHTAGEIDIAGTFTWPPGTYTLLSGTSRWFEDRLTAVWAMQFQGGERIVGITDATVVNQEALSGTFDDRRFGRTYPVHLVRIGGG